MDGYFVHPSSIVDGNVTIGAGTKIWHFSHIQSGAVIGENCSFGQNVNIAENVKIGSGVKVQNNVSVYEGVELEDGVFCGPSMVFTNDLTPRAAYPKGRQGYRKTLVCRGATLGANCTILCGHTVGRYAMVAAGAVVTKDVESHALVAGVPAEQTGWVCECGHILKHDFHCPRCGREYRLSDGRLVPSGGGGFSKQRKYRIKPWACYPMYRYGRRKSCLPAGFPQSSGRNKTGGPGCDVLYPGKVCTAVFRREGYGIADRKECGVAA